MEREQDYIVIPWVKLLNVVLVLFCYGSLYGQAYSDDIQKKIEETENLLYNEQINEGLKSSNQGLLLAAREKDSSSIVSFYYLQSRLFRATDLLDSAMNSLVKGSVYAAKRSDKIKINHQIGEILLEVGSYNLAIPYLEEMVDEEEDLIAKFYHYNLLGQAYLKSDLKEVSIKNFEDQLQVAKEINDSHLIINAKNNLGLIYASFDERERAKEYLNSVKNALIDSVEVLERRDKEILINSVLILAKVYYKEKDYGRALHLYKVFDGLIEDRVFDVLVYESYILSLIETNQFKEAENS